MPDVETKENLHSERSRLRTRKVRFFVCTANRLCNKHVTLHSSYFRRMYGELIRQLARHSSITSSIRCLWLIFSSFSTLFQVVRQNQTGLYFIADFLCGRTNTLRNLMAGMEKGVLTFWMLTSKHFACQSGIWTFDVRSGNKVYWVTSFI